MFYEVNKALTALEIAEPLLAEMRSKQKKIASLMNLHVLFV